MVVDPGGPRNEVHQAPDLAGAEGRRRRSTDDLDLFGGGEGRRIGAAVLDPLEAAEIVLGQCSSQVQRPRHPVIAVGEGPGRHGDQIVEGAHAVTVEGRGGHETGRARGLEQRLGEAEHRVAGLPLEQSRGVARGNGHALHGGLGRGPARRREGQGRSDQQDLHSDAPGFKTGSGICM